MNIKTFPLQFTKEYHEKIKQIAEQQGITLKDFILQAIQEKIERTG